MAGRAAWAGCVPPPRYYKYGLDQRPALRWSRRERGAQIEAQAAREGKVAKEAGVFAGEAGRPFCGWHSDWKRATACGDPQGLASRAPSQLGANAPFLELVLHQ